MKSAGFLNGLSLEVAKSRIKNNPVLIEYFLENTNLLRFYIYELYLELVGLGRSQSEPKAEEVYVELVLFLHDEYQYNYTLKRTNNSALGGFFKYLRYEKTSGEEKTSTKKGIVFCAYSSFWQDLGYPKQFELRIDKDWDEFDAQSVHSKILDLVKWNKGLIFRNISRREECKSLEFHEVEPYEKVYGVRESLDCIKREVTQIPDNCLNLMIPNHSIGVKLMDLLSLLMSLNVKLNQEEVLSWYEQKSLVKEILSLVLPLVLKLQQGQLNSISCYPIEDSLTSTVSGRVYPASSGGESSRITSRITSSIDSSREADTQESRKQGGTQKEFIEIDFARIENEMMRLLGSSVDLQLQATNSLEEFLSFVKDELRLKDELSSKD